MFFINHRSFSRTAVASCLVAGFVVGLSGCSGGSSVASDSSTAVTGSVFAAPVSGASCEIKTADGVTRVAGPFTTNSAGEYSTAIPNVDATRDLVLQCLGGTYTDEADGSTQTNGELVAHIAANVLSRGGSVHATAGSTIVAGLVNQGMTFSEARVAFKAAFGYTPDESIKPVDATVQSNDASDEQKLAGLRGAAFSQLTADLALNPGQQFVLLKALVADLADGTLDGLDVNGPVTIDGSAVELPIDVQGRFALALINFREGGRDASGLGNDSIGVLPFAKTVLSETYKVEYLPGMMAAMQGKTQFKVRVSDKESGAAVTGEAVSLMPMMHMAAHNHSTPVIGCSESGTPGTFDCTVFYLMASQMMDGRSMGYWDLKVMVGGMNGESVHFHPPVMMAMGDTARAVLQHDGDQIKGMMANENRKYFLFKSALTGMGDNRTVELFIAAKASMMSFPSVYESLTLEDGSDDITDLTIATMSVEFSTDGTTWLPADGSSDDGYWSATGISGLSDGVAGSVYVKLTINGEQYTTNGKIVAGENGYATFTFTPSSMGM